MAMNNPSLLKLFLYICRKAQHVTTVSEGQKREIQRFGIKRENLSVFPMCIGEDFLEVGRNREKVPGERPIIVLSNRNFLPIYNLSLLIRAIPIVLKEEPHIKFFLAGDGPERSHLESEAKELNVNSSLRFLGRISHEKMPNLLSRADIYVSTSLHDGTSVSLLEAMACGTFPVVTDILSNREWVSDGENGFLIPAESETVLARRIVEAIRNHRLLTEARKKNQEIVEERADWRKIIGKVTEIYERNTQPV
jgi:glycosyltransferase involved in cell wall biosynthesis